jgi:formylglycine-generating enzyme required for sulfatase activity
MKKINLISIAVAVIGLFLMSFKSKPVKEESLNCKEIDKSVVKIQEKLFAGKFEVSNLLYREFLNGLSKNNKTDLLKVAKIDSSNWTDKLSYNQPMVELYFRHPAYSNYPLVNVSYEGANLFCEWLTNEYNSNPKRKFKKVIFRLPTESEWEQAASGGLTQNEYAWGNQLMVKDHYMCNFQRMGDESIKYDTIKKQYTIEYSRNIGIAGSINDNADITAPVSAYWPNQFGIYNVCGNVSEMVKERGIARGGSWKNVGGDVKIKSKKLYTKSQTDVGFRYFMEVIEL